MRIGIDFDNTIICYDGVFRDSAVDRGLVPPHWVGDKTELRDLLRERRGGEFEWQALQGYVYGAGIKQAKIFDNVDVFFNKALGFGVEVYIVSHKTQFGHYDPERINLRDVAIKWIKDNKLLDSDKSPMLLKNVLFADNLEEKIKKITDLSLDIFIDDLPEVLQHSQFPRNTRKIFFNKKNDKQLEGVEKAGNWLEIIDKVLR